jgi:hypothetical protein
MTFLLFDNQVRDGCNWLMIIILILNQTQKKASEPKQ